MPEFLLLKVSETQGKFRFAQIRELTPASFAECSKEAGVLTNMINELCLNLHNQRSQVLSQTVKVKRA